MIDFAALKKLPQDLGKDSLKDSLNDIAARIRTRIIEVVSQNGGHLSSNLGSVEIIVAMHYVFDCARDPFIFDVSHQAYAHKLLTGRWEAFSTLRQTGGLSGFLKPSESPFDYFVAGHSSTSISLAVGAARSIRLKNEARIPVVLIGDGAMSAGLVYEALDELGDIKYPMIIILNDNEMSISKPIGAMSKHLSTITAGRVYRGMRDGIKKILSKMPESATYMARRFEESLKLITPGILFEELGLDYIGPIDGHNIIELISIMQRAKALNSPVIIHAQTTKGYGYKIAQGKYEKWHSVAPFDIATGAPKAAANLVNPANPAAPGNPVNPANPATAAKPANPKSPAKSANLANPANLSVNLAANPPANPTKIFAAKLLSLAKNDDKIVGLTAAMPSGTGLDLLIDNLPSRFFDVAIAEAHATTSAAAMAKEGFKPFVAVYSTFLQRAFDSIIHDVGIMNLPVRFAIDRAGIVGEDGETHQGSFDISYLTLVPNMVVFAPRDNESLELALDFAAGFDAAPCAFRYPRGGFLLPNGRYKNKPFCLGKAEVLSRAKSTQTAAKSGAKNTAALSAKGGKMGESSAKDSHDSQQISLKTAPNIAPAIAPNIAFLGFGNGVGRAHLVNERLNFPATLIDLRFAKPLDSRLILAVAKAHDKLYIFSDGAKIGGLTQNIAALLLENGVATALKGFEFPDSFIPHGKTSDIEKMLGLDTESIAREIQSDLRKMKRGKKGL